MPEVSVTSLPARIHRQVDNARTALDRGNGEYSVNICREILRDHPGCLPVRRLLRAAQTKLYKQKNPILSRALGGVFSIGRISYGQALIRRSHARAMDVAESILTFDPTNLAALTLLARAAGENDLPETAAFALEAVCDLRPEDRAAKARLADACIAAGRVAEAVSLADHLLREKPADLDLQDLAKRASVAQSIAAGRWDSASGTYRDKLRDEDLAVSLEQSGKVVNSAEMSERLIAEAAARIELEPENLNHYRAVINGCRALGNTPLALEWIAKARALPVGSVDANLEKLEGDLRIALLDQKARERRAAVVAEGGNPERDDTLARLYRELTDLRIATLSALAEKYPSEMSYKFDLGKLMQRTGGIEAAILQFQLAQRSPKLRIPSIVALGECFKAKGLFDLAVQQFELAKSELGPLDDEKKDVIYQLAASYEAMGQAEKAFEEYKAIYSADIAFRDVASKIDGFYSRR
ncbi:MAG: tetratricopeptide repeat protein [Opitutaceae bacterium]